jgi:hypothetical protein
MLTTEPILEAMHRLPFLPFKIQMRGGKVHEVRNRDHIAVSPSGKAAVVVNVDGIEIVNVRLIAELVVPGLEEAKPPNEGCV